MARSLVTKQMPEKVYASHLTFIFCAHIEFNERYQRAVSYMKEDLEEAYRVVTQTIMDDVFYNEERVNIKYSTLTHVPSGKEMLCAVTAVGDSTADENFQKNDLRELFKEVLRQFKLKNVGNCRVLQYSINVIGNNAKDTTEDWE